MWKKLLERLSGNLKGEHGVRFVVLAGICGMALILLSGILPSDKKGAETAATDATVNEDSGETYCRAMELKLAEILEQIDGVGDCQILITADSTAETVYAQNEEQETAEQRTQIQKKYVLLSDSAGERPLIQRVAMPEISGVIVVCDGASGNVIRERVTNAIQAVLNLPANRICVLPSKS